MFVSPATRSAAALSKATKRPSAEGADQQRRVERRQHDEDRAREHEVLAEEDCDRHDRLFAVGRVADVKLADLAQAMDEDEAVVLVILDYQYFLRFEHA